MGRKGCDFADGVADDGTGRFSFGWIGRRIERCDLSQDETERIFDCVLAVVVLCTVLSACMMTASLHRHTISLIMSPILTYLIFSSPGFNLRLRECRSLLIITDIWAVLEIIVLCTYMDRLYFSHAEDMLSKMSFCLVGILGSAAYLCRSMIMYYLSVPFFIVFNTILVSELGATVCEATAFGGFLAMLFVWTLYSNSFYFGIGRVCHEGTFFRMPEEEARYVRKLQRTMERERKRRAEAELERKKEFQRQRSR